MSQAVLSHPDSPTRPRLAALRVLILTSDVGGRGGIQYCGRMVMRALREWLGPEAELTLLSVNDTDPDCGCAGLGCTSIPGHGSRWRSSLKFWQLLRGQPWDLVVLGHLNLAALLALVRPAKGTPIAALIYGIEAWQPLSRLRRSGLQQVDRLLYISRHTRNAAEEANPWLAEIPNDVCHLALLPERDSPTSPALPEQRPATSYAVAIGRMARAEGYKGFEELIRIWPRVAATCSGARLVLIGDGDDRKRLQELAESLDAPVEFTGGIDDQQRDALLHNCSAFCLPSRGEGFGLVYLEAMRVGKPVLAGASDAGSEVVLDEVTGRTVLAQDAVQLYRGLCDVLGERGPAMGAAGRQRYLDLFSYPRFLERFSQQLQSVLNGVGNSQSPSQGAR